MARQVAGLGSSAQASSSTAAAGEGRVSIASPSSALPFTDWCGLHSERAEQALAAALPPADTLPSRLHEGMRYAVLGGGKRVRPLLVYAAGELAAAPVAALDRAILN